ncbi:MAG TPA: zinc ribbon domain-containing protein [bacterium]|nr:zinc ribbon domain-containing protein [bacterium]HPN44719.1 zinc ribbon domain-containing protein [bacterium]
MKTRLSLFVYVFVTAASLLLSAVVLVAQENQPQNITCPQCGYINQGTNKFCINCGAALQPVQANAVKSPEQHTLPTIPPRQDEKKIQPSQNNIAPAKSEIKLRKVQNEKLYEGPVDPRRLFLIPTAEVLNSLEVAIGGGSIIGEMKEEKRPFLGRISMGLGDIAEIEASTVGIVSGLAKGSAAIPTAAFKLKFIGEQNKFPYIGLAGALRSSLWHSEERGNIKFQKRVSTLYFVGSKTINNFSAHAGIGINDLRIRTKNTKTDALLSPTPEEVEKTDKDYVNKNVISPLVGVMFKVNPKTSLMMEFEYIPEYIFDEKSFEVSTDKINTVWMVIAGVRFFILDWLPLDTGVLYRSDYHGIGDMHIQAGLNVNLPLPRIFKNMSRPAENN